MATMSLGRALNVGLRQAMEHDPKVVLMGEDIGKLGGVFRVTEGLQRDFGERRVIDTPLAESGVIGTAVGLAMRGYRPVCEIQFDGFVYPAFDQIVSQVAKLRYRNEGRVAMPITIRVPYGGGIGAVEHHSESPEAYFTHTAGLRVVTPSSARDGHQMIQQAIASDDPVVFFEPKRRYWDKGEVDDAPVTAAMPLHQARVVVEGSDATVAAYGRSRCGPDRRVGGNLHRGDRPAIAVADRLRHGRGVGPQDRPSGGRSRSVRLLRARGRDRSPRLRALLLPPRVARAPGRRLRDAVPAVADGASFPP
jgi:deoxyxylulose-5-phosphate synthase